MSLKKRIIAVVAAAVMACSLASCADTSYIMKANDDEIAAGVYINLMLTEYTNQVYSMYYSGNKIEGTYFDQKVDGVPMAEHLENYAYKTCLEIVAVEKKCKELGIKLSEKEEKEINEKVQGYWDSNGDYYFEMGVSKESLKRIDRYSALITKLFEANYGEGGIQEVTDTDIQKHVDDNFLRFKQIKIAKSEGDSGAAAKVMADKYMEYAKEMDMDALIEKYNAEIAEDSDSSNDSSNSDSSSDSSNSNSSSDASTSSSDSLDSSSTDSNSSTDVSDSSSSDNSDSSSSDSTNSKDDSQEESKTDAEIESEKYPNDYVRDKSAYEDDKLINHITSMALNKIELFEDDDNYYILEKLDMKERTEFAKANKNSLIQSMKSEEFVALVKELTDAVKVDKNEKSFKRYSAKDVYEKQVKYSEKNSSTAS
ncbi:MAG: hypothetical protein GX896_09805 [Clostridiales bacterium]|nr:hypothetical protein [Clostridiales bacterium]